MSTVSPSSNHRVTVSSANRKFVMVDQRGGSHVPLCSLTLLIRGKFFSSVVYFIKKANLRDATHYHISGSLKVIISAKFTKKCGARNFHWTTLHIANVKCGKIIR